MQHRLLYLSTLHGLHDYRWLRLGLSRTPSLQWGRSGHRRLRVRRHSGDGNRTGRAGRSRTGVNPGRRAFPIVLLRLRRTLSVLYRDTVRWWLHRSSRRRRHYRIRRWWFNLSARTVTTRLIYTESLYLLGKLLLNLRSVLDNHRLTIGIIIRTRYRACTSLR